jgi:hypothetical protein
MRVNKHICLIIENLKKWLFPSPIIAPKDALVVILLLSIAFAFLSHNSSSSANLAQNSLFKPHSMNTRAHVEVIAWLIKCV